MAINLQDENMPLVYNGRVREYAIRILDGGTAVQIITFCPWCGNRLPGSLRDQWFERLRALNLEPEDPNIPEEMKSAAWWNK